MFRNTLVESRPTRLQDGRDPRAGLILATVAIVQFMVSLDLSIVNLAIPRIELGLGFSNIGATWVIDAYAITFGGLLLFGGKAADRFGRRRILLLGLAVFALASLGGGFAPNAGSLIAARAAQGVGAALLSPAALALLTSTFSGGRPRVRAFGIWAAANAAGGALGVLIGGVLTQYAGWRSVMFVNVVMAAGTLLLAWRALPTDARSAAPGRLDVLGAVLGTGGISLLVFGVVRTDQYARGSPVTLLTLSAALVLLLAFVYVERAVARDPLVRLGLFANRAVAGANLYNLFLGGAMAATFYFMSLYLQGVLRTDPALTGLEFLPFALGVVVGSVIAIRLGYHVSPRTLLAGGGLLTAIGFIWFGFISADGTFVTGVLGPSIVASIGFGLCLGPVVSTATIGVAPQEAGSASGLLNSSRQIGASLGLAALGAAAAAGTGPLATPQTLTRGYALGMLIAAGMLLAAVVVALTVIPGTMPTASSDRQAPGGDSASGSGSASDVGPTCGDGAAGEDA
ncbi:MFS transporter [Humibacter ginsenosidimutans]|uniref:MFS transporter n=1 Tax=Humibacter ginsenosidimutans TaxID=2599293 RepID=UPI001AEF3BC3|nr:MFS transporter [Humibacter ginsenosidimutans]